MTPNALFVIIIFIAIASFVFEQWIGYLNTTTRSNILPHSLRGFYDQQTYSKQQDYERDNYRFELLSETLSFFVAMSMLWFSGFAWVDALVRGYSALAIVQALLFFGILGFVSVMDFSRSGSQFLFGPLMDTDKFGSIFAFQVLPTIVFFSSLTSLLFYETGQIGGL